MERGNLLQPKINRLGNPPGLNTKAYMQGIVSESKDNKKIVSKTTEKRKPVCKEVEVGAKIKRKLINLLKKVQII